MKRIFSIVALILTVSLSAAYCDDGPTDPSDLPDPTFRATLSSANEVPAVANAEAGASGVMDITINAERDAAGAITGGTVSFNGTLTGFPAGTAINLAHIHIGAAGTNGGVRVDLALTPGQITLPNGSGAIVKADVTPTDQTILAQIVDNPAGFYFNVHTALNPGGAVRGQLVRTN
jgi:hypothetical protein